MRKAIGGVVVVVLGLAASCSKNDDGGLAEGMGGDAGDGDGDAGDGDAGDGDAGDGDAGDGDGMGGNAGDGDGDGDGTSGDGGSPAGDGDGDAAGGGAGGADNSCPDAGACDWDDMDALSCDDSPCCSELTCFEGACIEDCGQPLDELDQFTSDFRVVAQLCGFRGSRSLQRAGDACEEPVVYQFDGFYDQQEQEVQIAISRTVVRPYAQLPRDVVFERVFPWSGVGAPSAVQANFAVNPGETRLVFWITDTGTGTSQMYVVDLETMETESLSSVYPGQPLWLDDDRFLQVTSQLEASTDSGLFLIDVSGDTPEYEFVAGQFGNSAVLGRLPGDLILTGGNATQGGTDPALAAVPLDAIEAVVSGERVPIDIYNDADIQRFPRGELWRHFGSLHGDWFVAPSNSEYTEYQVEVVSVDDGSVTFGDPIPLPFGDYPYPDVVHLGGDLYSLARGSGAIVLERLP